MRSGRGISAARRLRKSPQPAPARRLREIVSRGHGISTPWPPSPRPMAGLPRPPDDRFKAKIHQPAQELENSVQFFSLLCARNVATLARSSIVGADQHLTDRDQHDGPAHVAGIDHHDKDIFVFLRSPRPGGPRPKARPLARPPPAVRTRLADVQEVAHQAGASGPAARVMPRKIISTGKRYVNVSQPGVTRRRQRHCTSLRAYRTQGRWLTASCHLPAPIVNAPNILYGRS